MLDSSPQLLTNLSQITVKCKRCCLIRMLERQVTRSYYEALVQLTPLPLLFENVLELNIQGNTN